MENVPFQTLIVPRFSLSLTLITFFINLSVQKIPIVLARCCTIGVKEELVCVVIQKKHVQRALPRRNA